ncbi:MAG TPA: gluconokinase [Opitutaceae bacterium]|nr:gluconokinase [Opitutaceae bacterium]HND60658.1 gluconokinase [Opitutaceae bacterium]
MVVILMGVAGSGKTTIGRQLASELGWEFADADDFHPPANIAKMSAGQPLDDHDRAPWLAALRAHIDAHLASSRGAVVTCSALRDRYRARLQADPRQVRFVYLKGSRELLWSRISSREGHFMKADMLDSQLAMLEEPADALVVDIAPPPAQILATIRRGLSL